MNLYRTAALRVFCEYIGSQEERIACGGAIEEWMESQAIDKA